MLAAVSSAFRDEGGFTLIRGAVTDDGEQDSEVELQQQRMIESEPPDARRLDTRTEQTAHRLVEAGRLAYPARPQHELEPAEIRGLEGLGEEWREPPFDRRGPGGRHFAVVMPWVLLDEDLRVVSCGGRPRAPTATRRRSPPGHVNSTRGGPGLCAVRRIAYSW